jgi:transcriptional regulator with XRE-family HTH domain
MLNNTIKSFIVSKNLSPSKFADEIGVQRSSISHILSGRNKPSLDVVQKIIRRYPEIGTDWLLEEPPAPEPVRQPVTAAPASNGNGSAGQPVPRDNAPIPPYVQHQEEPEPYEPDPVQSSSTSLTSERQIIKVLVFYSDGTFGEFSPAGK